MTEIAFDQCCSRTANLQPGSVSLQVILAHDPGGPIKQGDAAAIVSTRVIVHPRLRLIADLNSERLIKPAVVMMNLALAEVANGDSSQIAYALIVVNPGTAALAAGYPLLRIVVAKIVADSRAAIILTDDSLKLVVRAVTVPDVYAGAMAHFNADPAAAADAALHRAARIVLPADRGSVARELTVLDLRNALLGEAETCAHTVVDLASVHASLRSSSAANRKIVVLGKMAVPDFGAGSIADFQTCKSIAQEATSDELAGPAT